MAARVLKAASLNCDGIDPDNMMVRNCELCMYLYRSPRVIKCTTDNHNRSSGIACMCTCLACLVARVYEGVSPTPLRELFFIFFLLIIPFIIPSIIFAYLLLSLLPLVAQIDPGSHSRLFSPYPATVRAFIFIASIFRPFLPLSTRIELLCLPTLQGALNN